MELMRGVQLTGPSASLILVGTDLVEEIHPDLEAEEEVDTTDERNSL